MVLPAYREQEGGHGRQELRVNHGEDRGQVALPGPHKEQPVDRKAGGRPHHRAPRQGLSVSLTHSAGNGEPRGLLTCSPPPSGQGTQ